MNYQSIIEQLEAAAATISQLTNEFEEAWGILEFGHLMVRMISNGFDLVLQMTDGTQICECATLRDLVGAINYELNQAVVF